MQFLQAGWNSILNLAASFSDPLAQADVVFLPNFHDKKSHLAHQVAMINKHFNPMKDVLLIEAAEETIHFDCKKETFLTQCSQQITVDGWADKKAYYRSIAAKEIIETANNFEHNFGANEAIASLARRILQKDYPDAKTDVELLEKTAEWKESKAFSFLLRCMINYQSSLIRKINEWVNKGKRVFVDAGFLHVNKTKAVAAGYFDFLDQVDRLNTALYSRKVVYLNPPEEILKDLHKEEDTAQNHIPHSYSSNQP